MQHHFDISKVQFTTSYDDESIILMADEHQIQQALIALFVNAVEAMPDGGYVCRSCREIAYGRRNPHPRFRYEESALRPMIFRTF